MSSIRLSTPDENICSPLEGDLLGRGPIVKALAGLLVACTTPTTISLVGPWGVGKTRIIKYLQRELERTENAPSLIVVNAWNCYRHDPLEFLTDAIICAAREKYHGSGPVARSADPKAAIGKALSTLTQAAKAAKLAAKALRLFGADTLAPETDVELQELASAATDALSTTASSDTNVGSTYLERLYRFRRSLEVISDLIAIDRPAADKGEGARANIVVAIDDIDRCPLDLHWNFSRHLRTLRMWAGLPTCSHLTITRCIQPFDRFTESTSTLPHTFADSYTRLFAFLGPYLASYKAGLNSPAEARRKPNT